VASPQTNSDGVSEGEAPLGEVSLQRLAYGSAVELEQAFAESLRLGALFVPSEDEWRIGQPVRVTLDLSFCGREVEVSGVVAAVRLPGLARAGTVPGVSLQLRTPVPALREALVQATGLSLDAAELAPEDDRREFPRSPAHGIARLEIGSSRFPAEVLNVSYGGMLALLHGLDLGPPSEGNALLTHPQTGQEISVPSRIVSQARCDHGKVAVGVQFEYSADRIDEVMAFIDDLQSLQHAKRLAQVTGSLEDAPLADVIETLAGTSSEGTLRLSRAGKDGIVVHRDREILHAATGLVSGLKAVSRLLLWRDGRFAYQAAIEPFQTAEAPLPIEAALLVASVNRDEAVRHGVDAFDPDETFQLDAALMDQLAPQLDEVHREIGEHVRMGFPLGAILDILIHGDGVIYKALSELLESGVISRAGA
jgi:Tfp pilus assembly protein PilZ